MPSLATSSISRSLEHEIQYVSVRNINKSASLESIASAERLPLKLIELDVTDDSWVKAALERIVLEKRRIDVLVNNARYGLFGTSEDLSLDEIKAQFAFFGTNVY